MEVKELLVPPEADGERADSILARYMPFISEKTLRVSFENRDVKLDGHRISRDTRVHTGQNLRIYYSSFDASEPLDIVYEDSDVLLVNKRPGISVERDAKGGMTLTDLCVRHVCSRKPGEYPPVACHRLDNQTSGLCLFAKNENSLSILRDVFRFRHLTKEYECLVRGIPKPPKAVCHAFLTKDAAKAVVSVSDRPSPGSREIITGYEVLEAGPVSRLRVRLYTGRTHQIRAHLSALGHPVLGDDLYGDRAFNRIQKARTLRLCAVSLSLETGGKLPVIDGVVFSIPAPF